MGENVQDADLVAAIQRLPGADEYRELQHSLRALQQKWQLQTDRQSHFAQETQLNSEQWHQRCENRLSALIACNEEAIAKPRWLNGWLNFIRISQDIENSGLQRIRDAIMSHTLTIEDIDTGLEVAIFDQLAREIATERPHLLRVSGNSRSAMQKKRFVTMTGRYSACSVSASRRLLRAIPFPPARQETKSRLYRNGAYPE